MRKRVFISFAREDISLRNLLKGQARNEYSPFDYVDMSAKRPWERAWKTNCRTKIKGCDGMIAIITSHTKNADGQIWEIKCAKEEGLPVVGLYRYNNQGSPSVPTECGSIELIPWTWPSIEKWLEKL